jgi:hypothetical protein
LRPPAPRARVCNHRDSFLHRRLRWLRKYHTRGRFHAVARALGLLGREWEAS